MSNLAFIHQHAEFEDAFMTRFASLREMYEASLRSDFSGIGVAKERYDLRQFSDELEAIAGFIDDDTFDKVRVIAYDPSKPHSIAESLDAHPLHTDASFAGHQLERFMLHFKVIDHHHGGVSTFFPVQWILDAIPDHHRQALESAHVVYSRLGDAGIVKAFRGPILRSKANGDFIFRWRYDDKVRPMVVDAHGNDAEAAIQWVKDFLDSTKPIYYSARQDETVLVDNCRFLHGRTALSPGTRRVAWRAWTR